MDAINPAQDKTIEEEQFYFDCKKQMINQIEFEACISRPGTFEVKNLNNNITYTHDENPSEFEFRDYNKDGNSDLILEYLTNTPGTEELLLFNSDNNTFVKVEDFIKFPLSLKIRDTDYYFSYHKSGCADNNWDSDLFKIVDYKAIRIGNIRGIGCGNEQENGIYINNVNGDKVEQVKFIKRDEGYWDGKWDFMLDYWSRNYKNFK